MIDIWGGQDSDLSVAWFLESIAGTLISRKSVTFFFFNITTAYPLSTISNVVTKVPPH